VSCSASWHAQLLDPVECQRRQRYLRGCQRARFTVGVALTRIVLAAHLKVAPTEVVIDRTCARCGKPYGRPRLVNGGALDFSISHSGDLIVLAVALDAISARGSRRTVGVDVERIVPLRGNSLPNAILSFEERIVFEALDATAQLTSFYRYWVCKESVLKATGHGLSVPLSQLTISDPDQPAQLRGWTGRPLSSGPVAMHDLQAAPGYAACLAFVGRDAAVMNRDATALLLRP
jgi:4'-phosphopantetheinyl transferase